MKTKYSFDKMYRYEIVRRVNGIFQVWVEKKIFDDYMEENWFTWCNISDFCHLVDNIENAIQIGDEALINLCGKL